MGTSSLSGSASHYCSAVQYPRNVCAQLSVIQLRWKSNLRQIHLEHCRQLPQIRPPAERAWLRCTTWLWFCNSTICSARDLRRLPSPNICYALKTINEELILILIGKQPVCTIPASTAFAFPKFRQKCTLAAAADSPCRDFALFSVSSLSGIVQLDGIEFTPPIHRSGAPSYHLYNLMAAAISEGAAGRAPARSSFLER